MTGSFPDIEVLVVPDCPNQEGAARLVREALDAAGMLEVTVRTTVIESEQQATEADFVGSPSFRIDGRDPFPSVGTPSLACRLYRTETGLRGLPDRDALTAALRRARSNRER